MLDMFLSEDLELLKEMTERVDAIQWQAGIMIEKAIRNPSLREYVKTSLAMLGESFLKRIENLETLGEETDEEDRESSKGYTEREPESDADSEEEEDWDDV